MTWLLQPIMFHKRQNSLSSIRRQNMFCLRRQNRQVCQLFSGTRAGRFKNNKSPWSTDC